MAWSSVSSVVRAGLAGFSGLVLALGSGLVPVVAFEPGVDAGVVPVEGAVVSGGLADAEGVVSAFVRFRGRGAFEATQPVGVVQGLRAPVEAQAQVRQFAAQVQVRAGEVLEVTGGELLYTTHNVLPGVAVRADAEALRQLASRSDVESVSLISAKSAQNAASDVASGAVSAWTQTGWTGRGVRIAVIDTGLDYTHATFGGPGTVAAYEQAAKLSSFPSAASGLYDAAKFVGGYDFAGDAYNPLHSATSVPVPDANPLDCRTAGHGTHVAGTAAGYGVTKQGGTFRSDFSRLTEQDVSALALGPGSAPEAQLVAFRVFGCSGTTELVGQALDRVLDPNGDGSFSDAAQIVNLSVNTDFGASDDPENDLIDALTAQGVLTVAAAGNATSNGGVGDAYSAVGYPANAVSALAVANVLVRQDGSAVVRSSSARGQHGSLGFTKPDVAAPGQGVVSAAVASGSGGRSLSGTSMATPHVAGIAALVRQARPAYSAQQVKAAVMSSAVHGVVSADGVVQPVDRVGSGRVDAVRAVSEDLLVYGSERPEAVSVSFGVVEVLASSGPRTLTRRVTVENRGSRARTLRVVLEQSVMMPGVSLSAPSSVTVAPGAKAQVTVSVRLDPARLAKSADPSLALRQSGLMRQYVAAASGWLSLVEDEAVVARVPVHVAPKPVAQMGVAGNFEALRSSEASVAVSLGGVPVDRPGFASALGVFELGAVSPRKGNPERASVRAVDLQYVGASSTAYRLAAEGRDPLQGFLAFGISTWGNWEVLTSQGSFEVQIDTDSNEVADFWLRTERVSGVDFPVARLYTYRGSALTLVATYPVNGSWGDVDTNLLDSNALVLPVKLADLGLTGQTRAVKYRVASRTWSGGAYRSDGTGWVRFKPFDPSLQVAGGSRFNDVLFADSPGRGLTLSTRGPAYGVLFLHLHNATGDLSGRVSGEDGGRAQVVLLNSPGAFDGTFLDPGFVDVRKGDPFYREIAWVATQGISRGWPDRTFRPAQSVERGTMAAFFYRMAGSPAYVPPLRPRFSDVPLSHPFYKEISWLAAQGITTGWEDGSFRPAEPISRAAMAAFFYRMAGRPAASGGAGFTDVPVGHPFYREISWMAAQGISRGWEDGSFRPADPVSRAAMAAFIYRFMERGLLGS